MVFHRVRKLVVARRWKSGPGGCQEAGSGLAAQTGSMTAWDEGIPHG
jgi:hypothetical protein